MGITGNHPPAGEGNQCAGVCNTRTESPWLRSGLVGALCVALVGLCGCTPRELAGWVDWYELDPQAATEFANRPEIQALLHESQSDETRGLVNNHPERWEQIAWCESGRQWSLRATNRTGTYGGGLMIRDNVWRAYGGQEFAATADQATKAQQIHVAERILDDVGWGAWDCA